MARQKKNKISLCQPDGKKGCSACCGLFNFKNTKKSYLTKFFNSYEKRKDICGKKEAFWAEIYGTRSDELHICPYQGFIGKGNPGCMIPCEPSYHTFFKITVGLLECLVALTGFMPGIVQPHFANLDSLFRPWKYI